MSATATIEARSLPHDLEAERAILGACMRSADAFGVAMEKLASEDFYRVPHRQIFDAMRVLSMDDVAIDILTLKDRLVRDGRLEEIGGPVYLASLIDGISSATNVEHYAHIVREKSELRIAIYAAQQILADCYEARDDARTVIDRAEASLLALASRTRTGGFSPMSAIVARLLDKLEEWSTGKGTHGVLSGLADLDNQTRGFHPANLIVIGARPGNGKSALALTIAKNVAKRGQTVGVFSLEMTAEELGIRALASESRVDSHRMQSGNIGERDYGRISQALGTLHSLPLHIDDSPFLTAFDVRTRARKLKVEHGLDLIIVDYAQLLGSTKKYESRTLELGDASRMLKGISKELAIPVIALSQLSRKVDDRQDKRPVLSDLRESGALEQDADVVMFIYREEAYTRTEANDGLAELIVAKQRQGPVGTVKVAYIKHLTEFANLAGADIGPARRLPMGDR